MSRKSHTWSQSGLFQRFRSKKPIAERQQRSFAKKLASYGCLASVGTALAAGSTHAQDKQLAQALSYGPRNQEIEYQKVSDKEAANCQGKTARINGVNGYLVTGPTGETLRFLADNDGDRSVDQWSYYLNGIEVHRELDTDGNGVADSFRWLGTAGTRWGDDPDEDGVVDSWKVISPEEVTEEVVAAVRTRNAKRYQSLLVSPQEIGQLGLGDRKADAIEARVKRAGGAFDEFVQSQKTVTRTTRWTNFGADRPGVIPAGTEGSTQDLTAYENVVAVIEDTTGKPEQLMVGTLLKVGDGWRIIDLPRSVSSGSVVTEGGFFFASTRGAQTLNGPASGSMSERMQSLLVDLDKTDTRIAAATGKELELLHSDRADLVEKLITEADGPEERETWVRQFADTVSAASQSQEFPFDAGLKRLERLQSALDKTTDAERLGSYVAFRTIEVQYAKGINAPNADFTSVENDHLKRLEVFVEKYPKSDDSAEALIRIGLSNELARDVNAAKKFYGKAAKDYASTPQGKKAKGAIARLSLEGQSMRLTGTTLDGQKYDSGRFAGKPVIVHYWASWCEPCKADMKQFRELQAKYARQGLTLVGINVDDDPNDAREYLKTKGSSITWPHLYEDGGMESSLAVRLGVLSLPVTLVIDDQGKVAISTTHYSEQVEQKIDDITSGKNSSSGKK
jgi:thiol-disulfide isomerase/thioredoxin